MCKKRISVTFLRATANLYKLCMPFMLNNAQKRWPWGQNIDCTAEHRLRGRTLIVQGRQDFTYSAGDLKRSVLLCNRLPVLTVNPNEHTGAFWMVFNHPEQYKTMLLPVKDSMFWPVNVLKTQVWLCLTSKCTRYMYWLRFEPETCPLPPPILVKTVIHQKLSEFILVSTCTFETLHWILKVDFGSWF